MFNQDPTGSTVVTTVHGEGNGGEGLDPETSRPKENTTEDTISASDRPKTVDYAERSGADKEIRDSISTSADRAPAQFVAQRNSHHNNPKSTETNNLSREVESLELDQTDRNKKYEKLMRDYDKLFTLYNSSLHRHKNDEKQIWVLQNDLETLQSRHLHEENERLRLQKDNALLRSQIAEMTNAQEPLRDEEYYIREFQGISGDIEAWAAKETRSMNRDLTRIFKKPTHPPLENVFGEITTVLCDCGSHGQQASEWLTTMDKSRFQERRYRIAMIRQFCAIVLLDRIFDQFVFGMSKERSDYFREIERSLCKNGSSSSGGLVANFWQ
jgi:hypothetical protein